MPVDERVGAYGGLTAIGRGTFASVYRAWQPTFERDVAIKVLSETAEGPAFARFERECAAIGALSGHPNIVTVFDLGMSESGRPCIVMELLEGGSLADCVATGGPRPWEEVVAVGVKLAGALESAHRAAVLHLDVKPENILLSRFGEPKLTDFGLARVRDHGEPASDVVWATLVHAAPEVLAGAVPTRAADVYSLASTLHQLLSGCPPFGSDGDADAGSLMVRVATWEPPDLRTLGLPDGLCRVLERALAKDPDDRPVSAAQLGRQLQAVQVTAGRPPTPLPIESDGVRVDDALPPPPRTEPKPASPSRARAWLVAILAGAVLMALAGADWLTPATVVHRQLLSQAYADDFDGPRGWWQRDDGEAMFAYEGGRYRMVLKRSRFQDWSKAAVDGPMYGASLSALGDSSTRVSVTPVSGTGLFGIVCRGRGPTDPFYEGVLGADGSVRIAKWDGSRFVTLTQTTGPRPVSDRSTRLRFDCLGNASQTRLSFFVDDVRVAEAVDRDGLGPGTTGLVVASAGAPSADVVFDDVVVLAANRSADG